MLIFFGFVFGILGIGCFWKPARFGPIASRILENMARNAEERDSRTYGQNQQGSKNSPHVYTERGNVTIKYGSETRKGEKRH